MATMHRTGLYIWIEDQKGQVISNSLFWDLDEKAAREEADKLHAANPMIRARYVAHCKEIFKI